MLHRNLAYLLLIFAILVAALADPLDAKKRKKKKGEPAGDPYATYVWPPPPDDPRIKLERVIQGRADVEAKTRWGRILIGASPQVRYDRLLQPFAVAFDPEGRIVVSDAGHRALIRYDLAGQKMDVMGTKGQLRLARPMGMDITSDGTIYVADAGLQKVIAFDPEGTLAGFYGSSEQLDNPSDVAVSPDGTSLFVADSKSQNIHVFDRASRDLVRTFGGPGEGNGKFNFPTSLAFDPDGNLLVVDQLNARIQVFDPSGDYLDQFGGRGIGFGNFIRPKDIAVDEVGFIYVTDYAFNNVQLFDFDFTLLTFVGAGGKGPGGFHGASGIAVQGDQFAVVDLLGARVQIFRFIAPKES